MANSVNCFNAVTTDTRENRGKGQGFSFFLRKEQKRKQSYREKNEAKLQDFFIFPKFGTFIMLGCEELCECVPIVSLGRLAMDTDSLVIMGKETT